MIRPRLIILLTLGLLAPLTLAFAACGDDDDDTPDNGGDDARLRVVATVAPITSVAENIGGTKISLEGLVPEGTNSHTFEPPPSLVGLIEDADLIIINGLQLEEPTLELAEANKQDDAVILLVGDGAISEDEYKYDFSFPESDGKPNPHLWPNTELTRSYAQQIRDALVDLDPDNTGYYYENYEAFSVRLDDLHEAMLTATATVPEENRKLLTYHDSWAYWAPIYGFEVIGAIQPSDFAEPSANEVADLIDQVEESGVPAVFGSEVFPSDVLETIASESGAEYVDDLRDDDLPGEPGDELHSYLGLMVENMRIMISALGGDASVMDAVQTGPVYTDGEGDAVYPQ
ncbi:MAG TPA: metal ABC transporter substrate-binding protein [Dehalococcoidia bacterium]|nr:metal ABC transporter substrate-binding protein [Dehalococcoidia bacterium]